MMKRNTITSHQSGQSLVLILIVLVVGAIVAFAIAARTIQDIRRTGEERISDQAGTQVETLLDVTTSAEVWEQIWDGDAIDPSVCIDSDTDPCCFYPDIDDDPSNPVGIDTECEDSIVCVRLEDDVIDKYIEKDDVYEINVSKATNDMSGFTLNWTPDDASNGKMIVKVYQSDSAGGVALKEGATVGLKAPNAGGWGTIATSTNITIQPGVDLFVRIRAIGSGITVGTQGAIPPQDLSVLATCNMTGGVYREFVRSVPLYSYLPACFDYVLFDGSTMVENFDSF